MELELYKSYKIEGKDNYSSSDESICSVTTDGVVTGLSCGECIIAAGNDKINFKVIKHGFFDVSYNTTSFVKVNESIKINAYYIDENDQLHDVLISSKSNNIKINGNVITGLIEGIADINIDYLDQHLDISVTVINDVNPLIQHILNNHNSNIDVTYSLPIEPGIPAYYYDMVSSVNKIFFTKLRIDNTYHDKLPLNVKNNGLMNKVEFVTVHYTGNAHYGADADNNCSYFNNLEYQASIHYVTGRTNLYRDWNIDDYCAFAGLSEKYKGWHASDSAQGEHIWIPTGIKYEGPNPIISINEESCFTINGHNTQVQIPERPDGLKITGPTFIYEGKVCQAINKQSIITKEVNGEYYIGNTWWGKQQFGLTLCNIGGNHNSIGIESCIDIGSDLMHTWHVTAQLVADIMKRYDLDISRVLTHHAYSGKCCPQPMLENNNYYWNYFLDMIKAEYEMITTFKDYDVTMEILNEGVANKSGLVTLDDKCHCIKYKVTITKDGKSESIILSSMAESYYKCKTKKHASLQNLGYEIK